MLFPLLMGVSVGHLLCSESTVYIFPATLPAMPTNAGKSVLVARLTSLLVLAHLAYHT